MPNAVLRQLTARVPGFRRSQTQRIEAAAACIDDPVARLRYLRSSTLGVLEADLRPKPNARLWPRSWSTATALLVLFIPLHAITDASSSLNIDTKVAVAKAGQLAYEGVPERYPNVWLIDSFPDSEVYSNGLRIETRLLVHNEPRAYWRLDRASDLQPSDEAQTTPAGIVFHTTESHLASFEAENTRLLKRVGDELLKFIASNKSYHYVIDRFGRVFRVVAETDAANHAGYSAWADARHAYVNLNNSFLGIAFEGQTGVDDPDKAINAAQIRAAAILTEMLRAKYRIPVANCVTHSQISVNPSNGELGFHTDFGRNFPFADVGLPDNYAEPIAALYLFGFHYSQAYMALTSERMWVGLKASDDLTRREALKRNVSLSQYADAQQVKYRDLRALLRAKRESFGETSQEDIHAQ